MVDIQQPVAVDLTYASWRKQESTGDTIETSKAKVVRPIMYKTSNVFSFFVLQKCVIKKHLISVLASTFSV